MKQVLEMRHLCPTAPDTLRIYPFKDSDPFILDSSSHQSSLNLGDEDHEEANPSTSQCTQVPNVFFVGTMNSYGEETLWQNNKFLKLISVPSFQETHSLVLLDLETMDTYQMTFDLSKEIAQVGEQLGNANDKQ
jgi:DNA polymerase delta subunit 2